MALIYRLQFTNVENVLITVDIADKEDAGMPEVVYIPLQGSGDPLHISTDDNAEEKFTPIKAKKAVIKFLSTANVSLKNFCSGEDDRFEVVITTPTQTLFRGFLVLDDNEQQFLDDETACEVTLTATDNLGLLKDIPLTNDEGINPKGKYRIMQFLSWALQKTGLQLDIVVVNNLMEQDSPQQPFYHTTYLDVKTFEKEVGESEDCYTVLEKILGEDSYITQHDNKWWIIRVDELQTGEVYGHYFFYGGDFSFSQNLTTYLSEIGGNKALWLAEEGTTVHPVRQFREAREDYNYDNPRELLDNIDFERGELWPLLTTADYNAYHVEDWTLSAGTFTDPIPATSTAYIRRKFINNFQYETERYLVVTQPGTADFNFVYSNPVPIGQQDKISIGVDFLLSENLTGPSGTQVSHFINVFLMGDDGSVWSYGGGINFSAKWWPFNGTFHPGIYTNWDCTIVNEQFDTQSISAELPPAPVEGNIYVLLNSKYNADVYYSNLKFQITPYINGTYAKFKGHYNKVEQEGNYKAKYAGQSYLGDAPRKYMKGAMFKLVDGVYKLTQNFYNGAIFPNGLPPASSSQAQKNLILVRHRNNVNNDSSYSYVGWYVFLTEVAPAGYYLVNGYEAAYHDTSAYPPDPILPPSIIPLTSLTYKGATQSEVILNTRFSNHFFTNQQNFEVTSNIVSVTGLPAVSEYTHPYGWWQAYGAWNQYRKAHRLFNALVGGMQSDTDIVNNIGVFRFTDLSLHTYEKYFMLLHFDLNVYLCEWNGTFAEVYDKTLGKSYADNYGFRYISDKN